MTIAQTTTIQAYQLRKGGTHARIAILRMIAADSVNNANPHTRIQPSDWRGARKWGINTYESAYGIGMSQGSNDGSPIWCSFGVGAVRNKRDAHDVVRLRHTGWFTDGEFQDEMAVGIVGSLSHGRFIAGYRLTMNDVHVYFGQVFDNEDDAAQMADEHARVIAEQECDYSNKQYDE